MESLVVVIVKIPKLNNEQRSEYLSRTLAAADTAEMTDAEKDNIKEKIYETGDLPRYGIDYTSVSSQEQIEQIRDKNQESPILDSSDNINIISRKDNLVSSVPSKRRLTYIDKRNSKFILFIYRFIKPVFAQTIIIKSIGTGAGRDYSTITAWESAQQGDLVLLNEIHKGEMYNDSPFDETLNIDGSITDANHYMWLTVAAGERHNGSASTGAVIDNQGVMGSTDVIGASDDYTKIEWIRFTGFNGINFGKAISIGAANITISKVIIHDFLDAINNVDGIRSTNGTGTVDNSIIYNGDRSGILIGLSTTINVYNSTVYNMGGAAINNQGTGTVQNTVAMLTSSANFSSSLIQSYNISSDNSAAGTGSLTNTTATTNCSPGVGNWVIFTSISTGSEDFHLQNCADNDALNSGSAVPGINEDIDEQIRPAGSSWEIGADEVQLALTPTPTRTPTPTVTPISPSPSPTKTPIPTLTPPAGSTTVNFSPTDDTHSRSGVPDGNFCGEVTYYNLSVYTFRITFMKFDLSSIAGQTVTSAKLWLKSATSNSTNTQIFKSVDDNTWTECNLTFNNEPVTGIQIATNTGLTNGSFISVDITSYVQGKAGGLMSLAIESAASTAIDFYADESAQGNRPYLEVNTLPAGVTATIAPSATPVPTEIPVGPNLDSVNEIYSYSGSGHYTLSPTFDGNRTPDKDVTVMMISGSLEISNDFALSDPKDSVAFIVNGNIYIGPNVTRIPGVYISSQTFSVAASDQPIVIEGMVYANKLNLSRTYYSLTTPTYQFIYQPKYIIDLLPYLGRPQINWQEVRP